MRDFILQQLEPHLIHPAGEGLHQVDALLLVRGEIRIVAILKLIDLLPELAQSLPQRSPNRSHRAGRDFLHRNQNQRDLLAFVLLKPRCVGIAGEYELRQKVIEMTLSLRIGVGLGMVVDRMEQAVPGHVGHLLFEISDQYVPEKRKLVLLRLVGIEEIRAK